MISLITPTRNLKYQLKWQYVFKIISHENGQTNMRLSSEYYRELSFYQMHGKVIGQVRVVDADIRGFT
jgi:hypothetical protein